MLNLLTVGAHQPYSAPEDYLQRFDSPKQAAVAYLDDALGAFLDTLEREGVLKDTLVVITSDESHGIDGVRLASSWGFNLTLAPEQASLPQIKNGTYGHVDLTTSILDYFELPIPAALGGRSLFREYDSGREIISFTNGMLRYHNGQGTYTECDFQQRCRNYASTGFIADTAKYLGPSGDEVGQQLADLATTLDRSLLQSPLNLRYQFGGTGRIALGKHADNDWTDNLIGAQYLEMPKVRARAFAWRFAHWTRPMSRTCSLRPRSSNRTCKSACRNKWSRPPTSRWSWSSISITRVYARPSRSTCWATAKARSKSATSV